MCAVDRREMGGDWRERLLPHIRARVLSENATPLRSSPQTNVISKQTMYSRNEHSGTHMLHRAQSQSTV